jgi:hypothetical protein
MSNDIKGSMGMVSSMFELLNDTEDFKNGIEKCYL